MKQLLLFTLVVLSLSLAACKSGKDDAMLTANDLVHRRFELVTMNGDPVSEQNDTSLELSFGENMRVSGKACNRFAGTATLDKGVLTMRNAASTRMFCAESRLNELETILFAMFEKGAEAALDKDTLTLKGNGHVLVYARRDLAQ